MYNIMIADDNLVFVKNLYNILIKQINNIHCISLATSGKETIEYIEKYQPSLLLLDLEMPNGNGLEVIKFINDNHYSVKIIIISAYYEELYKVSSHIFRNIEAILPKPVSVNNLIKIITNIINNYDFDIIEKYTLNELDKFNFNKKSIGYKYLVTAINIVIQRGLIKFNLEQDIYEKVSKIYVVPHKNTIKWSIDKLIKQMYHSTNLELLKKYFKLDENKKVTSKLIINTIFYNYYKK